jgi:hypothetical protein
MPRITVSDDLYDLLRDERRTPDQVDALATKLLTAHPLPYRPESRTLVVSAQTLVALDVVLGKGNIVSEADLLQKVRDLADIEVGKVKIPLSAPQLQALKERGARTDRSVRAVLETIVQRFLTDYEGVPV